MATAFHVHVLRIRVIELAVTQFAEKRQQFPSPIICLFNILIAYGLDCLFPWQQYYSDTMSSVGQIENKITVMMSHQ